ncbi:MAG: hypothetical protein IKR33_01230 [Bacteroidales bacterium]|nr:hypothetical protein [Bacteroidales bacterium]
MKNKILLFAFSLLLLAASCQPKAGNKQFDPRQVAFQAEYNPLFDGQIYPSLILGLNQSSNLSQIPIFNLSVTAPRDNSVLRVVIDSSSLNYVTIIQEILPHRGERYTFQPSLKWKYDIMRRLRQPGAIDLTFTCYINDEEVDINNLHLGYRTVNECPLSLVADGQTNDFRWLFAAYVNEDHPQIEQILTEIMEQGNVSRISGYQNGERAVQDQVFAVWYYALNRGISYSSITCTSNPSPRANVQHIRFFDEVWGTRQANCVDACVFFASILRKMGLKPIIFVEPCHAYLGYYTDKNRKKVALLETTITSWVNFPELERSLDTEGRLPDSKLDKVAKYLSSTDLERYKNGQINFEQLKRLVARSLFDKAAEYDRESYNANREHFADSNSITYQQLDIELLRNQVQPIN